MSSNDAIICCFLAVLYVSSFIFSITMFLMSILPRRNLSQKKKNSETLHVNYYYDLSSLNKRCTNSSGERNQIFNKMVENELKTNENIDNQIFTNADICKKKHDKIICGMIGLIPFIISFAALITIYLVVILF